MANTAQAKKRARKGNENSLKNASKRSAMRTSLKNTQKSLQNNKADNNMLRATCSLLDKSAGKGLIHPNKAARLISRLNKKAKALNKK